MGPMIIFETVQFRLNHPEQHFYKKKMKAVIVTLCALIAVSSAQIILSSPYSVGSPLFTPLGYSAPIAAVAPVAAIQSGYVAATRGSLHTAPLPEGPFAASHHINTAPAPGTF